MAELVARSVDAAVLTLEVDEELGVEGVPVFFVL